MKKSLKGQINKIGGWLILVLIICIYSAISALYLLMNKLVAIFTKTISTGVYISTLFLITYLGLILITIFFIMKKRKKTIKIFIITAIVGAIFSLWHSLIGPLIYFPDLKIETIIYNLLIVIINLVILLLVLFYFLRSKRVKRTLVN